MGYTEDIVNIVSMNSTRPGLNCLPRQARGSYLNELLNGLQPDIGVLPGDDPALRNNVIPSDTYSQYMTQEQGTLMVYDVNRITMTKQGISDNIFNDLSELNPGQIAWPEVVVSSLQPVKTVVKTFSMVTIPSILFQADNVTVRERRLDMLITLCQRLAIVTGNPILMAGEIRLTMEAVRIIVSRRNNTTQQDVLSDQQEYLNQFGFLPSMTKGATRESRKLFKLDAVPCKGSEPIVKTWSPENADCFIASQALEMSEAKGIKVEEALGRQVKMAALKQSCVTKTEMHIPVRPPKHHGG